MNEIMAFAGTIVVGVLALVALDWRHYARNRSHLAGKQLAAATVLAVAAGLVWPASIFALVVYVFATGAWKGVRRFVESVVTP